MPMSSGGHVASSSGCATRPKAEEIGLTGYAEPTRHSSPIGRYVMATAEHREPCESRGSCTVLGAPGGEIPPGDSLIAPKPIRPLLGRSSRDNTRPRPHNDPSNSGGAVREGSALLQGLASCGHCGRRLRTHYSGRNSAPGYHCSGERLVNGRGSYCLNIGGVQIDEAVTHAFIAALEPARLAATLAAAERLEADHEASRAERRYRAVDPDNRLVARGLERDWEESLSALEAARAELARREQERPRMLSEAERASLLAVGADISAVWNAPTTSARDRKELLRTLLEEVIIKVERDKLAAHLTMRWKGGALTELNLYVPRFKPQIVRTDEDTLALVRRLAMHYPDGTVAGILNRQGRKTAYGHRFQAHHVTNLRQRS